VNMLKNPKNRFKANLTYHVLTILDTTIAAGQQPVNALVGQAQYDLNILKGAIFSSTYYNAGSGLQPKEDYTYVAVAPGTGVYAYTDFGHNGIKELNDFYVAPFQDEADYIRVYTPTNLFIKTYNSGFTETLSLRPSALLSSANKDALHGVSKFIARFSEQLAVHVDRKTTSTNLLNAYNPFIQNTTDTNVVGINSSLRNTVFFNQLSPVFGADYTFSDNENKTILEQSGAQARVATYNDLHARLNITRKWMVEMEGKDGLDISSSALFANSDYYVNYYQTEPKLSYQPKPSVRITLLYIYNVKANAPSEGGGTATQNNA